MWCVKTYWSVACRCHGTTKAFLKPTIRALSIHHRYNSGQCWFLQVSELVEANVIITNRCVGENERKAFSNIKTISHTLVYLAKSENLFTGAATFQQLSLPQVNGCSSLPEQRPACHCSSAKSLFSSTAQRLNSTLLNCDAGQASLRGPKCAFGSWATPQSLSVCGGLNCIKYSYS